MADCWIYIGGRGYRLQIEDGGDEAEYLGYLAAEHGEPAPLPALSRQQVLTRLSRTALPADLPPDVVVGDAEREGGFTRGWFDPSVSAWESAQLDAAADKPADNDAPVAATDETSAGDTAWRPRSRQWSNVPPTADARVAIVTSHGVVAPSGMVLAGPLPSADALGEFIAWRWPRKQAQLPQLWITPEAAEAAGFADDEDLDLAEGLPRQVADLFGCTVTHHQSGWFTAKFAGVEGQDRPVHLVLMSALPVDPSRSRPGDMGVAGIEGTDTELPDDEVAAAELLGGRIAWLAGITDGVAPAARWSSVGASVLDSVRRRGRSRDLVPCPLPPDVAAEVSVLEPDLVWSHKPHRARGDSRDVEVDQRAAYLASAGQIDLGYGQPHQLDAPDPAVFGEQAPPFGLWRLTLPPAAELDGLSKRLPLPHPGMAWDRETSVWVTTRGVQQLAAPVAAGGAGLSVAELAIDAAWVWPQSTRMLRTWADTLRAKLTEAREEDRQDHQDFIKAAYTAYLGRMATSKWHGSQRLHEQPAWAAAIRADTRWRAMRYAHRIAAEHSLYPIAVEVDAWIYRLTADVDLAILDEGPQNGKYRVKAVRESGE